MSASRVVTAPDCTGRIVIAVPQFWSVPLVPQRDDSRPGGGWQELAESCTTRSHPAQPRKTRVSRRSTRGHGGVTSAASCTFLLQGLSQVLHRCYVPTRPAAAKAQSAGRDGRRGRYLHHTGFHPQGELMRRGIAATALVASFALAATACGGSDSGDKADGPVTITWWDTSNATNEAPTYKALIKDFEAANKNIKVKYVNVQFDQAQNKFDTAAGASGAPDVLRSEVGWTPAFAKKGYFLPLDGTEALADQAKFKSNLIEQAKYDGKTYGVPIVT